MNPNRQSLLSHRSTARALLGGVARINPYDHTTSILSFVRGVRDQLMPGYIRDTFCQTVNCHPLKQVVVDLFKDITPRSLKKELMTGPIVTLSVW